MESKPQDSPQDPEKSLFLIKAKPDALNNAENWLRGKGWVVNSTANVRQSLAKIIELKPKFVLVCMDHPNNKVRMLPKLLEQAFQIKIIVFLESTNARSISQVAGYEYVLYPPLTGTAIDRMCSKIDRDQRRKSEVTLQRSGGNLKQSLGTTDDAIINVKGSANLAPSHVHIQEQARKALLDMIKSDDPSATGIGSVTQKGPEQNRFQATQSGPVSNQEHGTVRHSGQSKDATVEKNEQPTADSEQVPRAFRASIAKSKSLQNFIRPESGLTEDSNIVESVHVAIEQSAQPDPEKPTHALGICSEMMCFPVGSSHHHGYVLCAMAKNSEPLLSFVEVFREKLTAVMGETDKHFTTGEPLPLSLTPVKFEEFAHHQAHLVSKFVHLDRECAIAYFDEEMPEPLVHAPIQADMIPVSLQEVHAERPLQFDVFLHLPQNEKFIRYGKKDKQITSKQKSKLEKRGVAAMHLHESQKFDLFRHRLQIFINGKIAAFQKTDHQFKLKSI